MQPRSRPSSTTRRRRTSPTPSRRWSAPGTALQGVGGVLRSGIGALQSGAARDRQGGVAANGAALEPDHNERGAVRPDRHAARQPRQAGSDRRGAAAAGAHLYPLSPRRRRPRRGGQEADGRDQRALAHLGTAFSHHLLGDEQDWFMELADTDFAGLSDSFVAAARAAATERDMPGKAIVTLSRSSVEPFLKSSSRRELREKAYKAFTARGDNGNPNDNNETILEILKLREESAKLLGFPTFAAYRLEDSMAKTPEAVRGLLERVWKPAPGPGDAGSRRPAGAGRAGGRQLCPRPMGLALLRRKAAPGQSQFRRRRHQAVPRARPHDRGGVRLRHAAVRRQLHRAQGCPGLAPGRAGLGGQGQRRPLQGAVLWGLFCPALEALGRLDDVLARPAEARRRGSTPGHQCLQLLQGR